MFVTTHRMLRDVRAEGHAVGAFNAENAEMVWAIVEAAQKAERPVIIQTTPSTLKYLPPSFFAGLVRAAAERVDTPIALHLDHGANIDQVRECVDAGYSSVMIDGSALSFEENVELTCRAVDYALQFGIPVEAELGCVGGKHGGPATADDSVYTDPVLAAEFVRLTCVNSLAIAFGTAHGVYREKPKLDLERVVEIRRLVEIPLVMHGASGLGDEIIRAAVARGISKVNFATELRMAYTADVRQALQQEPESLDPKTYGRRGREAVKELVEEKLALL